LRAKMENSLYTYNATVTDVYDGDTITVDIDLGLKIWVKKEKIRLARIDAPEIRGNQRKEGLKSRNYLRRRVMGREITLITLKDKKGKYGRYLGEVYINDADDNEININDLLVSKGYAIYKNY
jgi:micrococcal nuclease